MSSRDLMAEQGAVAVEKSLEEAANRKILRILRTTKFYTCSMRIVL